MRGLRPALPELGSASLIATRFRDIFDPQQLEHEVAEEEAAAGCALPRMFVRRSFQQTKLPQTAGAWRADDVANEHMIDFGHLTQLSWLESRLSGDWPFRACRATWGRQSNRRARFSGGL